MQTLNTMRRLTRAAAAEKFTRSSGQFDLAGLDVNARTVPLSFSSETAEVCRRIEENGPAIPEILLHEKDSADLSWIRAGGSLLLNHDPDQIVGSVVSVSVENRRGRAVVKFATTARGQEAFQLVREGALKGVSFGYEWAKGAVEQIPAGETFRSESGVEFSGPAIIVKRWRALEITLTPVPADVSVGVARSKPETERGNKTVSLKRFVTRECLRRGIALDKAKVILEVAEDEGHAREMLDAFKKMRASTSTATNAQADADENIDEEATEEATAEEAQEEADEDEATGNEPVRAAATKTRSRRTGNGTTRDPIRAERLRAREIRGLCRESNLGDEFADELIEGGVSVEAAAREILESVNQRAIRTAGASGGGRGASIEVGEEANAKKLRWIEAGISKRFDPLIRNTAMERDGAKVKVVSERGEEVHDSSEGADDWDSHMHGLREYTDSPRRLTDYAREYLRMTKMRGVDSMSDERLSREIFSLDTKLRAASNNVSASLPNLLANVLGKQTLRIWKRNDPTWRYFCKIGTLNDYKQNSRILMSDTADLVAMNENGVIPDSQISDSAETIQLKDFGRGLSLTHQMFINDDLNALATINARITQAALRLPTRLVYTKLLSNPTLAATGKQMFYPTQNNLNTGAGSALAITGLTAGVKGFRKQVSFVAPNEEQFSAEPLDVAPRILLVPPEQEKIAFDLVNPNLFVQDGLFFKGKYIVVVEPRLSTYASMVPTVSGSTIASSASAVLTTGWYLFADPSTADTMEVGFLNGSDKPMMRQIEKPDRLALDLQVVLPCAVAPLDYRGAQWNLGA